MYLGNNFVSFELSTTKELQITETCGGDFPSSPVYIDRKHIG